MKDMMRAIDRRNQYRYAQHEMPGVNPAIGYEPADSHDRSTRLRTLLNLLRYAETEAADLGLETSSVLLSAAITDVGRKLG